MEMTKEIKKETRREHFNKFCYISDLSVISRMFWNYAIHKCGHEAPLWEKDQIFEEWMDGPFDSDEWAEASKNTSGKGSIPRWVFDSWSVKPLGCF